MIEDEYEYFGVYPSTLFVCYNGIDGMHFILSLKHTSTSETTEFVKILHYCSAEVSTDLEDITAYSAVIVDHNDEVNFEGPVFTLKYITDCLELCKLQDISNYRRDAARDLPLRSSCMSVVYFRVCTWANIISTVEGTQRADCNSIDSSGTEFDESEPTSPVQPNALVFSSRVDCISNVSAEAECESHEPVSPVKPKSSASSSRFTFSDESDEEGRKEKQKIETTKKTSKNTRLPYSHEERCDILKYIVHHSEYARLKGRELWMIMERRKVCPSRTWQSMKEHFLKRIVPDLSSFKCLTEKEREKIKNIF